jgi:hypothetical protein
MDIIDSFISRYMAVPNYVGAWLNSTHYVSGQNVLDIATATIYLCAVTHTSSATPATFTQDRATYPTYWHATTNVITSGAGATISVGDASPSSPKTGDLWFETTSAQLYVFYVDANSAQWVIATNQPGNIGDASSDGLVYGRQNAAWVATISAASPVFTGNPTAPTPVYGDNDTSLATTAFVQAAVAPTLNDVGRNKLHNSMFNVAQRGQGPFTSGGYTADRWSISSNAPDVLSFSLVGISDADRTAIGDDAISWMLQNTFTGSGTAGAYHFLFQRIEGLRRLASRTVILSFWARATAGTPKLGINAAQNFGTGGSPSTQVVVLATGNSVTLSTTWTRYTSTIVLPSVAGKTFGTVGDDNTQLEFWYSSGATLAARSGNIGMQTGTIQLVGVQLEIAQPGQTQPTPLEKPDPVMQLQQCQRFYQTIYASLRAPAPTAGNIFDNNVAFAAMRAIPTAALITAGTVGNATSIGLVLNASSGRFEVTAVAAGDCYVLNNLYSLSADL